MSQLAVEGARIRDDLRALGLRAGDTVLVHSSLRQVGWLEGGAETLRTALLDVLGPEGTLAVPTFPFRGSMFDYLRSDPDFELETTPSLMGALTEAVRTHPAALRSWEPTHPVSAVGPQARFLTEDHIHSAGSCDEHSPFVKLCENHGKVLLLGVDFRSCTLLHAAEELARVPFIDFETRYPIRGRAAGRPYEMGIYCHSAPLPARFPAIEPELAARGLLTLGNVGHAECRLFCADRVLDLALELLRENPSSFRIRDFSEASRSPP